jgi:hypothetical protein
LEIDCNNWSIVKKILDNSLELTLTQRLKDIFGLYKEIITIYSPILSHFEKATLEKAIQKLEIESRLSIKLVTIVNSKIDGDSIRFEEARKEVHDKIISELNTSPNLQRALLHLIEYLLVEKIAKQLSTYRNDVAHFNERYNKIKQTDWKFGIRILELCVQICILNMFGLTQQEINEIYSSDGYEDKKIAKIISSIDE